MPGILEKARAHEGQRGVYLLTHPRSASNMFQTMMSKQPGYQSSGYKLFDAGFASLSQLEKGRLSEWPKEEREALNNAFRAGFNSLEDELEDARKNVSCEVSFVQVKRRKTEMDAVDPSYEMRSTLGERGRFAIEPHNDVLRFPFLAQDLNLLMYLM